MDSKKISHDIQNAISRLEIMHDLAREKKFDLISKQELSQDLDDTLQDLKKNFESLINQ